MTETNGRAGMLEEMSMTRSERRMVQAIERVADAAERQAAVMEAIVFTNRNRSMVCTMDMNPRV